MDADFLSSDTTISFILARLMVRPLSMLEAPSNAAWPPLLTANLHLVTRDVSTARDTSRDDSGVKWHAGLV